MSYEHHYGNLGRIKMQIVLLNDNVTLRVLVYFNSRVLLLLLRKLYFLGQLATIYHRRFVVRNRVRFEI